MYTEFCLALIIHIYRGMAIVVSIAAMWLVFYAALNEPQSSGRPTIISFFDIRVVILQYIGYVTC